MTQRSLLLTEDGISRVQEALTEMGLDGWLLFDFHGQNPIAFSLMGVEWHTRRAFALIPSEGEPELLIHTIEHSNWRHWPWKTRDYSGWREMEEKLAALLEGRARLAMETSPRSNVPTLDRVPAGVLQLLTDQGVEPVSSGDLVSAFYAVWSDDQLATHRNSARVVAEVARDAFRRTADQLRAGETAREGGLAAWIRRELAERGLPEGNDCIVAIGARAADPHYDPGEVGEEIRKGHLLLIDLWGQPDAAQVPADQTWMGFFGSEVPAETLAIWNAVREARDRGLAFLGERHAAGRETRGYEVDDEVRGVITEAGWGDYFVHRTGHSIDRELHGSGPNLDNLETKDDRLLLPGVGFSVEPGIYVPDRVGVRSEVNVFMGRDGPEITGPEPQKEIFRLLDD